MIESGQQLAPDIIHILILTAPALAMAFSRKVRKIIYNRDNGKCVICDASDHVEAAHIDHTRNAKYNEPRNGRLLCRLHHYLDHYYRGKSNGLLPHHNEYALNSLWDRLSDAEKNQAKEITQRPRKR